MAKFLCRFFDVKREIIAFLSYFCGGAVHLVWPFGQPVQVAVMSNPIYTKQ
jgi:hypothetical protein